MAHGRHNRSLARVILAAAPLLVLLLAPGPAQAQAQTTGAPPASPTIYSPPAGSRYRYSGCFNETTDLPGTARERALDGGAHRVSPGAMTAQACIDFCSGGDKPYRYAGLEFSRECWCANRLSVLAARLDDGECNTACDGDKTSVCGGPLRLSVYMNAAPTSAAGVPFVLAVAMAACTLMGIFT